MKLWMSKYDLQLAGHDDGSEWKSERFEGPKALVLLLPLLTDQWINA